MWQRAMVTYRNVIGFGFSSITGLSSLNPTRILASRNSGILGRKSSSSVSFFCSISCSRHVDVKSFVRDAIQENDLSVKGAEVSGKSMRPDEPE